MDDRLLESLEYNCGPLIMEALRDETVIEIMLNPDGKLWIERYGQEQKCIGELPLAQGKQILSLVASALDIAVRSAYSMGVSAAMTRKSERYRWTAPALRVRSRPWLDLAHLFRTERKCHGSSPCRNSWRRE